jgi:hypothetical protein
LLIAFKSSADNTEMESDAAMILESSGFLHVAIIRPGGSPTSEPVM